MDNYEAIMKMNKQQLGAFLDGVYCTGLNDGMYATLLPEDKADEILAKNPYGENGFHLLQRKLFYRIILKTKKNTC